MAVCRRCCHLGHVNSDGLCRLCLLTIRTDDPGWIIDQRPGGSCQLGLILPGVRLPNAQPLDRPVRGRTPDRGRPPAWLERLRAAKVQPADDPRVLPPAAPRQLCLMRPRRHVTDEHEARIRDRVLRGQDALKAVAFAVAAERGFAKVAAYWLVRMARLALAMRDADGEDLVPADVVDDLPQLGDWTAEVLRRTGLLVSRVGVSLNKLCRL
jgi:hypothetical protein